jgi:hypothetical protein
LAKYLFLALSDCSDPSREPEFNKWYDEVHIPDLLSTPGAIQASRYVNTDPEGNKRPKYLAVIEIETDDIDKFNKGINEVSDKAKASGRGTDCIVPDRSVPLKRPYFKLITPVKKAKIKK